MQSVGVYNEQHLQTFVRIGLHQSFNTCTPFSPTLNPISLLDRVQLNKQNILREQEVRGAFDPCLIPILRRCLRCYKLDTLWVTEELQ
jgi:hypothetical protein